MAGNIRLWGTSGYVELAAPNTATNQVLTLPTDSVQPALILINKTDFSASSAVSINNCFSSSYSNYRIMVNYTGSASAWTSIRMRSSGVDDSSANYHMQRLEGYSTTAAAGTVASSTSANFNYFFSGGTRDSIASYDIFSPARSAQTVMTGLMFNNGNAGGTDLFYHGIYHALSNSYDGFSLIPASGTISGTVFIYGYRNS